jgi:hypothetical protein
MAFSYRRPTLASIGPPPSRSSTTTPGYPPHCEHPTVEARKKMRKDGVWVVALQCLVCGGTERGVAKRDYDLDWLPAWNEELSTNYHAKRQKETDRIRETAESRHKTAWEAWYTQYLETEHWRALRVRVMARDKNLCQGCLINPAYDVHHLTYDRLGREMLFDLVAMCRKCHDSLHGRS